MVLLAGSELFTGNCLLTVPLFAGEVRLSGVLKNWIVVYFGNFTGALFVAAGVVYSHQISLFGNGINRIAGESFIKVNTEDAEALGIKDREMIAVVSRRGRIETRARVSRKTRKGDCWMPFHYLEGGANWLTNNALDKISSTPEYKVCAIRLEKLS